MDRYGHLFKSDWHQAVMDSIAASMAGSPTPIAPRQTSRPHRMLFIEGYTYQEVAW